MARNETPVWTNTVEHHSNAFTPKGEFIYFLHFKRCKGRGLNISTSNKKKMHTIIQKAMCQFLIHFLTEVRKKLEFPETAR